MAFLLLFSQFTVRYCEMKKALVMLSYYLSLYFTVVEVKYEFIFPEAQAMSTPLYL